MTKELKQSIHGPQGQLSVETIGDPHNAAVIFIHSDLGALNHWHETMRHSAEAHYAIAFDRRGHGASDAPRNGDYSIEANVEDALAIANTLRVRMVDEFLEQVEEEPHLQRSRTTDKTNSNRAQG